MPEAQKNPRPFIIVAAQTQKISLQDVGKPNGQGNGKWGVCNWPAFNAPSQLKHAAERGANGDRS